jgi:ketosteroid isomerase-like protein
VSAFQHPQALAAEQAAARALLERLSERIAAAIAAELDGAGVDLEDDDRERVSRSGRKLARRFAARVTVDGEGPER